jgi:hypothetical protein
MVISISVHIVTINRVDMLRIWSGAPWSGQPRCGGASFRRNPNKNEVKLKKLLRKLWIRKLEKWDPSFSRQFLLRPYFCWVVVNTECQDVFNCREIKKWLKTWISKLTSWFIALPYIDLNEMMTLQKPQQAGCQRRAIIAAIITPMYMIPNLSPQLQIRRH